MAAPSPSFADVLRTTDVMGYWAHASSVTPETRLAQLNDVAGSALVSLDGLGEPATSGDRLARLHTQVWLACLPSLRATAANQPHTADIATAVLEKLASPLRTLLEGVTGSAGELPMPPGRGLLGECAVLGTLLWAHATDPSRAGHRVLPATASQDQSKSAHVPLLRTGFDLLRDTGHRVTPVQVKAGDIKPPKKHQVGHVKAGYNRTIAVVYLPRLFGPVDQAPDETTRTYAAELLADAVLRSDQAMLTTAINGIDHFLKGAWQRTYTAERFYGPPENQRQRP